MDRYEDHASSLVSPATGGGAVTPSNTADLAQTSRALYVGQGGDLSLVLASGSSVTLQAVPTGALLPLRTRPVLATGTTASGVVALW